MAGQLWGTNSVGGFMYSDELSDYLRLQNFPLTKWRPLADALLFAVAYPLMMVLALLRMAGGMTWKDRRI